MRLFFLLLVFLIPVVHARSESSPAEAVPEAADIPFHSISDPEQQKNSIMTPAMLKPCPGSPNCVSSRAQAESHHVDPISYRGSGHVAFDTLKDIVARLPGTRIIESSDSYLHAEFRTRWLKFIDDFEAIPHEQESVIHIRSASRVGYWDLGTNRRRVEMIRDLMLSRLK